jgi:1-deoxy-D-xylulose-5-phosphate reductoisomerase
MGPKITVDSATLMNKALEVIEAERLFGVSPEQIRVVIHPQSVVHGLVRLRDGALMAQLSWPDMKLPIQYALTYPDRIPCPIRPLNFEELLTLTFEPPDHQRFPALRLAYEALHLGGTAPTILNAVNEVAVEAFLGGRLPFPGISQLVAEALEQLPVEQETTLDVYLEADQRARVWARAQVGKMH